MEFIEKLGIYLLKWAILFYYLSIAGLVILLLLHLYINTAIVAAKRKAKMQPIINKNFYNKSQKLNELIYTVKSMFIIPGLINFMPKTKLSESPLGWFVNCIKGVLNMKHPDLIYQYFPPGKTLLSFKTYINPLSSQTFMSNLLSEDYL